MKIRIFLVLALLSLITILRTIAGNEPVNINKMAAALEWQLKGLDGKTIQAADFKGKVVILDFWATWCGPCRAEIPSFVALQKQYQKQGLVVIGASVDDGGADMVKAFTEKLGMKYPVGLADDKVQKAFGGIDAIPTTFVIDRSGHIVKKHLGLTEKDEFEAEIKPLLAP
ncbi:MAG TPA: TlpA disulfide reductase family protein [Verrucomicrobiae bacterium]|jgi:peroxiredoxin